MSRAPLVPNPGPVNPADRGQLFTVQLRGGQRLVCGRLTHVASGQASHFDSGEELVARMLALLGGIDRGPDR